MDSATRVTLMVAIVLAAIGAINWGLVGLFEFDLVAAITTAGDFGETNLLSRIIYIIVGAAGIISLGALPLLRRRARAAEASYDARFDSELDASRRREAA
ncbi:MAG: DUF378 domain-containing protein [Dehalococcoidia bacterium]